MTLTQILSFMVASELLLIIPGPSVLFAITRALALGRRAAVATVAGNSTGALLNATAVALGVGAIVERSVTVFTAMKLIGAAYLVFLGIKTVRERGHLSEALRGVVVPRTARRLFRDGFVVGLSNPKSTLFFLAVLPQFVRPEAGHPSVQLFVLGVLFCAQAFVSDCAYGWAAGSVRNWLERRPDRLETVGGASGVLMIGLGVRLALTGRKD